MPRLRFTGFEYGILILGLCLVLTGTAMILRPTEVDVGRPGSSRGGLPPTFEHVSQKGVVVAGGFTALCGLGFLAAMFHGRRNESRLPKTGKTTSGPC
ncbi:hypothetical protein [Prosthecobacter sp.]|uniref:hypothetical protein n=1 Tax=Prosthecobacter sp. TaxID=1965333 RepID=UPI003783AB5C